MDRSSLILLLVAALASCKEHNNEYCDGEQGMADPTNCPPDSPMGCTMDNECNGRICDTSAHECVECLATRDEGCTGTTPVCGDDRMCTACTSHAECTDSLACLPDGSCAADISVAYVDASGTSNSSCTRATPCNSVASALGTDRPYIKITGTIDEAVTISGTRVVTFLGGVGAKLTRTNNGQLVRVEDTANVTFIDLEISGALGTNVGLSIPVGSTPTVSLTHVKISNNAGGGVSSSGGSLTVSQSTISGNTGGGISVMNGTFAIVGNVFFNNGSQLGGTGGVAITTSQNAANRLEFNSFNKNQTQDGLGCAIQCVAGTFTAKSNIMSGNATATNMQQTGGTCAHAYSIARPGSVPTGTGNSAADPMFADVNTGDLHIMAASPARSMADPNSNLTGLAAKDIDGNARVNPADIGADEVP